MERFGTLWNVLEHCGKFWKFHCEMEEKKGGRKEGGRDEGERGRKERKEYVCSSCSVFVIRSTRLLARGLVFI